MYVYIMNATVTFNDLLCEFYMKMLSKLHMAYKKNQFSEVPK